MFWVVPDTPQGTHSSILSLFLEDYNKDNISDVNFETENTIT
jgi:hypothetical protein